MIISKKIFFNLLFQIKMKGVDKIVVDKLKKITVISFGFMLVQILGGYLASSIAIYADAFHLLSDVLAYIISLLAVLMSYKASPKDLTFGYEKLQPLGALVNVGIIWFVTVELFIEATERIVKQQIVQEPKYMLFTSIFGLLCNLYIMNVLHSDQHAGGHHNCSHSHHNQTHQALQTHHQHTHGSSCSHGHDHSAHQHQHHEQKQHSHQGCKHQHGEHKHEQQKKKEHKCGHDHDHQHEHKHQQHQHKHQHEQQSHREMVQHAHSHDGPCSGHHQGFQSRREKLTDQIIGNNPASDEQIKGKKKTESKQDKFHNNINIKAAYIHIITDIILSIGVIISAGIIYFFAPEGHVWSYWQIADPACTYLFSIMAIYTTIPIVKESVHFLLNGCEDIQIIYEIEEELRDNQIVEKVENLKVWSTTRGKYYGALRVKAKKGSRRQLNRIFSSRKIEGFVQIIQEEEPLRAQQ